MEVARAVGRWQPDGPWVGFRGGQHAYRLCVGAGDTILSERADAEVLLALAIAYFEEALPGAPPDLEATQADISELVRFVAASETDSPRRMLLAEAIDAIDDGLAGDAVAGRLAACRRQTPTEQADPVDLLVARAERLLEG